MYWFLENVRLDFTRCSDCPHTQRYNALVALMDEIGEQVRENLNVIRKLETPPTYTDIVKYNLMDGMKLRTKKPVQVNFFDSLYLDE